MCKGNSENPDGFAYCRAKGGTPQGNIYNFDCIGGDDAEWLTLPATEKVKRFSFYRYDLCVEPQVTFTGYGHPSHNTYKCWSPTTKSRYGVEYWSTGSMSMTGQYGTSCGNSYTIPFSALRTRNVSCPVGSSARDEGNGQRCYKYCPDGEILVNGVCGPPPEKNCSVDNYEGNPCNVATGNKYQADADLPNSSLGFTRHYNSAFLYTTDFGVGWRSSFQKEIIKLSDDSLVLVSPAGRGAQWQKVNGAWQGDADSKVILAETATGYRVTLSNTAFDDYNLAGKLVTQTDTNGHPKTLTYDSEGQLSAVTNRYGLSLTFTYTDGRLQSVTDELGEVTQYQYDAIGNLERVIYPDNTPGSDTDNPSKTYHYENAGFPNHLTGITDENGNRYATYAYDANGKAISTEHSQTTNPAGQEKFELDYQGAN